MPATSGKGCRNTGGMASVTTVASLPSARSASAIAIADPIASPSGRECDAMMNRRPRRITSISSAGAALWLGFVTLDGGGVFAVVDGIDHVRILDGARRILGVNLLNDLLDAGLRRHRF